MTNIILKEGKDSTLNSNTSRIKTVPTLDGGSVVLNSGVTAADKIVLIRGQISETQEEILWDFFDAADYLFLAYRTELYLVAIKSLSTDTGKLNMSIILTNKEN